MRQAILTLTVLILTITTAGASSAVTEGAKLGVFTQDFEAARKLAAEKEVPILVDFSGSDWCGWCILMDNKVFSTDEFKNWAKDNIALVLIDFPRDKSKVPEDYRARNEQLMQKYGVRGFPTFVVIDHEGKEIGRLGATRNPKPGDFIKQLEQIERKAK